MIGLGWLTSIWRSFVGWAGLDASFHLQEPGASVPSRCLRVLDATPYGLGEHVARLVGWPAEDVRGALYAELSTEVSAAVILCPVDENGAATEEALGYLSSLASACETQSVVVPVIVVWCLRADERIKAVRSHGRRRRGWTNEIALTTAPAWAQVRARHPDDAHALAEIDRRLARTLDSASHLTALAGFTPRFLSYVRRASGGTFHLTVLAECLTNKGAWHGHEMVAAALGDVVGATSRCSEGSAA